MPKMPRAEKRGKRKEKRGKSMGRAIKL